MSCSLTSARIVLAAALASSALVHATELGEDSVGSVIQEGERILSSGV